MDLNLGGKVALVTGASPAELSRIRRQTKCSKRSNVHASIVLAGPRAGRRAAQGQAPASIHVCTLDGSADVVATFAHQTLNSSEGFIASPSHRAK